MPTGYTCEVQNGTVTELKDYMLKCARNFGALGHMREDDSDTEIKHRVVSDYHLKALNKAQADLKKIQDMPDEDVQKEINQSFEKTIEYNKKFIEDKEKYENNYIDMIEKVVAWNPPTKEHCELREFALDQLNESMEFDCNTDYVNNNKRKETVCEYRESMIKYCLKDIEYHSKSYKEEIERVEKANRWIDDLINSLN